MLRCTETSTPYLPISIPSTFHPELQHRNPLLAEEQLFSETGGESPRWGRNWSLGVSGFGWVLKKGAWGKETAKHANIIARNRSLTRPSDQTYTSRGKRSLVVCVAGGTTKVPLSRQTQPVVVHDCLWHICLGLNLSILQDAQRASRPIKAPYQWTTQDFYTNLKR